MAFYRCGILGSSAGSSEPEFEETKICDNSSFLSDLVFTDDFANYDFIKFVIYNSDSQVYTEIITTPEMITNSFTYSNNLINFNETNNTQYVCYEKTQNGWTRHGYRNCNVKEVYGLKCTNKTVTKTTIYNREAIGSTSVTITSVTSLFDYDYLLFSSCTGGADETQPCNEIFTMKDDIFGSRGEARTIFVNGYSNKIGTLKVSEHEISSWSYYFFVQGVKFTNS